MAGTFSSPAHAFFSGWLLSVMRQHATAVPVMIRDVTDPELHYSNELEVTDDITGKTFIITVTQKEP